MHRQLVMTMPTEKTLELLKEKKDLENWKILLIFVLSKSINYGSIRSNQNQIKFQKP
jgi:hypothetical protein